MPTSVAVTRWWGRKNTANERSRMWASTGSAHGYNKKRRLSVPLCGTGRSPVFYSMSFIKGYMYILLCSDGSLYTGSTKNLSVRLQQHQLGLGANHTRKNLPVSLIYFEEYQRIDTAFYREKQIKKWESSARFLLLSTGFAIRCP